MSDNSSRLTQRLITLLKEATKEPERYPELSVQINLLDLLDKRFESLDVFLSSLDQLLLSRGRCLELKVRHLQPTEEKLVDFLKDADQCRLTEDEINHSCSLYVNPDGERVAITIESGNSVRIVRIE
ncbi:MAG: hypothetical protein ACOCZ8_01970 [Bacteroidota bacterium]